MELVKFSDGAGEIRSRAPAAIPCAATASPPLPAPRPDALVATALPFTQLPTAPRWPWALAVLAAGLVVIGYTVAHPPEGLARMHDRQVVYGCWKEQQKKSLPAESQQFIAVFCEELEKQFAQRYGRFP
jgi:hypothetical protein